MSARILTEIWIYPVKSLGGIRLKSSRVMEKGLQFDRRCMLVDSENVFMTQRDFHELSRFKTQFHYSGNELQGFQITHGGESVILPLRNNSNTAPIEAVVWDDRVVTCEVSVDLSRWFSEKLGFICKLVTFPEDNPRLVAEGYRKNGEHVSLADGFPMLMIGQSSLDDLNGRMKMPVPMNRFRPNLVFSGGAPYEEDEWTDFTIGKNRFSGVKPCSRCITTTIDQESGVRGIEPLLTLSRYRKKDTEIYFGQNVLAIDKKEIHEGDEIEVG